MRRRVLVRLIARDTQASFSLESASKFSGRVSSSVSNRLTLLVLAACFSLARRLTITRIAGSCASRSASLVSSYPASRL